MKRHRMNHPIMALLVSMVLWLWLADVSWARNIFLNGVDISSTRGQLLENVTIQIDDKGDLFINAPNYVVQEEENYVPLARGQQTKQWEMPEHKPPMAMQSHKKTAESDDDTKREAPAEAKAAMDKPPMEKPLIDKPAMDKLPTDKPGAVKLPTEKSAVENGITPVSQTQGVTGRTTVTPNVGSDTKPSAAP